MRSLAVKYLDMEGLRQLWNRINAVFAKKTDIGDIEFDIETLQGKTGTYDAHVANAGVHVTADDKAKWNGIDSLSEDVTSLYSEKADAATIVALLTQVRDALEEGNTDEAISLLDSFILDNGGELA